jgi:hypothetical protein
VEDLYRLQNNLKSIILYYNSRRTHFWSKVDEKVNEYVEKNREHPMAHLFEGFQKGSQRLCQEKQRWEMNEVERAIIILERTENFAVKAIKGINILEDVNEVENALKTEGFKSQHDIHS